METLAFLFFAKNTAPIMGYIQKKGDKTMDEIKEKATKAKEWAKRNIDYIIGFCMGGVLAYSSYKLGIRDGYLKGSADASKACYDKIMDVAVLIDEK